MSQAGNLARRLIDYDRETAAAVRAALEIQLREADAPPEVGDPSTTTREWKTQFARQERMRALCAELAQLLA